jgi:hypothetical protein
MDKHRSVPDFLRDREHGDATARIIGHHEEFARPVDRFTHSVVAAGRRAIEERGLAGEWIECEGSRIALVAMHRIEKALVRARRQIGRIDQVADLLDVSPCAGRRIAAINVNAVATRLALGGGERSHIGVHGGGSLSGLCGGRRANEGADHEGGGRCEQSEVTFAVDH